MKNYGLTLCVLLALIAGASRGWAAEHYVNTSTDESDSSVTDGVCSLASDPDACSLRAAIEEANANTTETHEIYFYEGITSVSLNRDIEVSANVVIYGIRPDSTEAGSVTVAGSSTDITVSSGAQLSLKGLVLESFGSMNNTGILTIEQCLLQNFSDITITNGSLELTEEDSITDVVLVVQDSEFRDGEAAGIYNVGKQVVIESSLFDGFQNRAIINEVGLVQISDSLFTNNTAPEGRLGGAIYNSMEGDEGTGAYLMVQNSTFSQNRADEGGAIANGAGKVLVFFSTVKNNSATVNAGGLYQSAGGSFSVVGTVIANNTVESSGSAVVQNCNVYTSITSTYSLSDDDSCQLTAPEGMDGIENYESTDPQLSDLSDNGGNTQTFLPESDSPVVDKVPAEYCVGFNSDSDVYMPATLSQDQRREGRMVHDFCDMGSVELQDKDGDDSFENQDCDDADASVFEGGVEICDGKDNDCDGSTDEDLTFVTVYLDADADGFGDAGSSTEDCGLPADYVDNAEDCNDENAAINPDATELCDGADNNCNAEIDEGVTVVFYRDADGDAYGDPGVTIDSCEVPDGYSNLNTDCDDTSAVAASRYPGNAEVVDGVDNDCDEEVDEDSVTYYRDADGDGFGNAADSQDAYTPPEGYVLDASDCDDESAERYPDHAEVCGDAIDQDCSGTDEACPVTTPEVACGNGLLEASETCDDGNTTDGDGCSSVCAAETEPEPEPEPSPEPAPAPAPGLAAVCGNGSVETGEDCDDGNNIAGDGCGGLCLTEPGIGNNNIDTDGDGVVDTDDAFPNDPSETTDTDGDGLGNNADTDDNGNGIADLSENNLLPGGDGAENNGGGCSLVGGVGTSSFSATGVWMILLGLGWRFRRARGQ